MPTKQPIGSRRFEQQIRCDQEKYYRVTCPTARSVHGVGFCQSEWSDLNFEIVTVGRDHLIGPFHHTERRGEWTARRVLKRFTRCQHRLFADDTWTLNFFNLVLSVGDDPVTANELHRIGTLVRNLDRIKKEPQILRLRVFSGVMRGHVDPDPFSYYFGFVHGKTLRAACGTTRPFILCRLTPEGTNAQLRLTNHYILLDGL